MNVRMLPVLCMLVLFSGCWNYTIAQERINLDAVKFDLDAFIFYGTPVVTKCDEAGTVITTDDVKSITAPLYATFSIHRAIAGDIYVIRFKKWNTSKGLFETKAHHGENVKKALQYNRVSAAGTIATLVGKSPDDKISIVDKQSDEVFFRITKADLLGFAYVYNPRKFEFTYGTISYLARMRPKVGPVAGKWTTDLNLGLAAGIRYNFNQSFGVSGLLGLAISKINLDSISTGGIVKSSSERPAFTPSGNLLFSYKNFSLGFGIGLDWINEDSAETKAWIYNHKIFYAIGFGLNIFNSSAASNSTTTSKQ